MTDEETTPADDERAAWELLDRALKTQHEWGRLLFDEVTLVMLHQHCDAQDVIDTAAEYARSGEVVAYVLKVWHQARAAKKRANPA